MNKTTISYKTSRHIDATSTRKLFQRMGFNDWFSHADVVWYLRHALFVASAWSEGQCVGVAVLTGDGRIGISIDLLLVDEPFQGRGVGSQLMELVVQRLKRLNPYHVSVEVFERRTEQFYARFGFVRNRGTWLLEYGPTAQRLRRKAMACRQRMKEKIVVRAGRTKQTGGEC